MEHMYLSQWNSQRTGFLFVKLKMLIFSNNLAVVETKRGGKVASMPLDEHSN
jgi:hypothetical protein